MSINDPLVLAEQKLQAIDTLLWKYTEADGKYNTPFRSLAALSVMSYEELRHDHVSTRKQLKYRLLASKPEDVEEILQEATGCLLTIAEHSRLSKYDRWKTGWQRYEAAGISWTDLRNDAEA